VDPRKKALDYFRNEKRKGRAESEFPVKKVTVMADSKESLEKGLEKAEDIVEDPSSMLGDLPEMEEMDHDMESDDDKAMLLSKDLEECSPEDLKEMVMKLRSMVEND